MAKLLSNPIGIADLEEYIRDHDDFALELDLFQHALHLDAAAEHGGTYVDPVSGRHRQFDLRIQIEAPERLLLLAVECKNIGKNSPLLVSRIPRERAEAFHEVLHSFTHRAPGEVPGVARDRAEVRRVSDQGGIYPAGRPVGKSTAQVGRTLQGELTSADTESYEKWSQALSSAKRPRRSRFPGVRDHTNPSVFVGSHPSACLGRRHALDCRLQLQWQPIRSASQVGRSSPVRRSQLLCREKHQVSDLASSYLHPQQVSQRLDRSCPLRQFPQESISSRPLPPVTPNWVARFQTPIPHTTHRAGPQWAVQPK